MKKIALLLSAFLGIGMIVGCGNNNANNSIKASMNIQNQKSQSVKGTAISKSFLEDGAFGRIKVKSDGKAYISFVVYERNNGVTTQQHFGIKEIEKGTSEFNFGLISNSIYEPFDRYSILLSLKTSSKALDTSNEFLPSELLITYEGANVANLETNLHSEYGNIPAQSTLEVGSPLFLNKQIVRKDGNYKIGFSNLNTLQDVFDNDDNMTPYILVTAIVLTETEPSQEKQEITVSKPTDTAVTYDVK